MERMAKAENNRVKMYGVWGGGRGPGTRGDVGKRGTTVGMWRTLNARLENSNRIWQQPI